MPERLLIIGNYGNLNIGDETILKGLISEISYNNDDIEVYIPTRNCGFEKLYHNEFTDNIKIISFFVYDFKDFFRYLIKSSKVIIGGGGIWSGYTGFLAKFIPIFSIFTRICGKNVSFKGVGIYNTASIVDIQLVNLAILLSDKSTVRDYESYNILWKNVRRKTVIQEDFAIKYLRHIDNMKCNYYSFIEDSKLYNKIREIRNNFKYIIGVSIKPTKYQQSNIKLITGMTNVINTVNKIFGDDVFWLFFPFSKSRIMSENDVYLTNQVLKNVNKNDNSLILDHENPIIWYFIIKDFVDLFIGMRYHSLIFSWVAEKPFFGISYENKNVNFLKQINHLFWCNLERFEYKNIVNFILNQIYQ